MTIPESCIPWIQKQRTRYKGDDIAKQFIKDITRDYEMIKEHLPKRCRYVLDIGCGVGGIDVLLSKHYNQKADFYLLDSSIADKPIYGFDKGESFYTSFAAVASMMFKNNVQRFVLIDAKLHKEWHRSLRNIDLVISLLSWGYHYPIDTYIDIVKDILTLNGTLIIDVREWTDGVKQLTEHFKYVSLISNENKSARVACKELKW